MVGGGSGAGVRVKGLALFALLVLTPVTLSGQPAAAPSLAGKWTSTDPPVNLAHIDYGEINRHGEAVGYHHRPNGVDPPSARVRQVVQPPDASGVYRARVALRDPATGGWIDKQAPSSLLVARAPDAATASSSADPVAALRSRDGTRTAESTRPTRCAVREWLFCSAFTTTRQAFS